MNVQPWSTLGPGDTGNPVRGLEYMLAAAGHPVTPDGTYGPTTAGVISDIQAEVGAVIDGVTGPETWPHVVVGSGPGSTGDAVRAIQQFGMVPSPGVPPLAVDGIYGPVTTERVEFFQASWGLTIDGIAGLETWSFLTARGGGAAPPWPLVKVGATQVTNWRVRAAQHLLRAHGAAIAVDGVFGPLSGAAVTAFQQTLRALYISTTVGQLDWPELIVTVREGDAGEAVSAVQTLLPGTLAVDGLFGPATDAAVREFQGMFAPPMDGIVGPVTWHALTQRPFD